MPADIPNEELANRLFEAKKKPRNFLAIVKGVKILALIVKKKPIKTNEIQEAKSSAGGNAYYLGTCQGDGAEMVFKVLEEPSVKTSHFRDFIAEQTGLRIKPRFEVVAEILPVDDEQDENNPTASPQSSSPQSSSPQSSSPQGSTDAPASATSTAAPDSSSNQPETAGPSVTNLAAQFKARLTQLKPKLEQAVAAGGELAQFMQVAARQMAGQAKSNDFPAALESMDSIEERIKSLPALFTGRLKGIKPDLDRALAANSPLAGQIKQHATAMAGAAKQGNFPAALAQLDLAEPLIRQTLARPTAAEELASANVDMGWVKQRGRFAAARGVWVRVRDMAVANIGLILNNMKAEFDGDPDNAQSLQAATQALEGAASRFTDELRQLFDEFVQDPPLPADKRSEIRGRVLKLIAEYRNELESNSLYADLDQGEFAPVLVKQPLLSALSGMAKDLA